MNRNLLLPVFLLTLLLVPLRAQRRNAPAQGTRGASDPVEVSVEDLQATPYGVSITLRSAASSDVLNMMIGVTEGQAIARALRHEKTERPMTHDLMKTVLDRNGWRVQKVLIRDLTQSSRAGGTFLADLVLEKGGQTQVYDARPSDAIALGLRYDAKILVNPEVFELLRQQEEPAEPKPSEPDSLRL
jgi:bifunctional DNase/RNase